MRQARHSGGRRASAAMQRCGHTHLVLCRVAGFVVTRQAAAARGAVAAPSPSTPQALNRIPTHPSSSLHTPHAATTATQGFLTRSWLHAYHQSHQRFMPIISRTNSLPNTNLPKPTPKSKRQEFLGRTAHDIGESVSRAPEAAASAAHKAVEIASGVAEHVAGRTREVRVRGLAFQIELLVFQIEGIWRVGTIALPSSNLNLYLVSAEPRLP